jgi:DNA-directed RNA polymerase subunit RPC12/RpoP
MKRTESNPMGKGHIRCPKCRSDDVEFDSVNGKPLVRCLQCEHSWFTRSRKAYRITRALFDGTT